MTTSVQLDRAQKRFDLWDVNGDGQIDRADWEAEAKRILQAFGEAPTSPAARQLSDAYLGMWSFFADKAGIDEHTGALTPEQFNHIAEEHVLENGGAGFGRVVKPTIQAMVELVDVDGDGQVNPAEFKSWLDAIGVSSVDPSEAFRQIDANGDGQLSVEELVQAVRAYHLGEIDVPLLGR
ncbi:EF-hand domain-containing protein [Kitasatospora sp. YST-16]|uniref:EF-hand domain-containing protein n=1 Tax=unclassified Kitasatospora TaxID=2633591 RepID=UPI0004C2F392|nr:MULTISPECIES: EF-hand domain-containing protein [unclassified Kitasatospora]WAL70909.1 EF-hand domain-containing protein [Kitasatospora sp. YST-16]WNW36946.1 EF-hand domain-containing protein [Streptomyces sp. Li-HN-5-13]